MIYHILRVGDGNNFRNSSHRSIWAVKETKTGFVNNVKEGDILWFIRNKVKGQKGNGKVIAVATFVSKNKRVIGPLLSITPTNDELGWDEKGGFCGVELHYKNLYNLTDCKLFTGQKNQTTICEYSNCKLSVNLVVEYEYICKYLQITNKM